MAQAATKFKIDSDIPLPVRKSDIEQAYDFSKLGVGQSFFVVADTKLADKIASAAREWGKQQDPLRVFVAERRAEVTETKRDGTTVEQDGVRIWRKT